MSMPYAGKGLFLDGLIMVIAAIVLILVPGISVDRYAISVTTTGLPRWASAWWRAFDTSGELCERKKSPQEHE